MQQQYHQQQMAAQQQQQQHQQQQQQQQIQQAQTPQPSSQQNLAVPGQTPQPATPGRPGSVQPATPAALQMDASSQSGSRAPSTGPAASAASPDSSSRMSAGADVAEQQRPGSAVLRTPAATPTPGPHPVPQPSTRRLYAERAYVAMADGNARLLWEEMAQGSAIPAADRSSPSAGADSSSAVIDHRLLNCHQP
ncbi:unnamed protein product [Strongylus vulgaris]|uniref:Uncharacterized protein n=1 Tax=Strongylus vulgaris TaxID=40348 RepID=A0A3P7LYP4_STRVU|nr:unnamed protein product [Strongylus vulgaris]